jgi:hypothetical protein
MKGDEELPLLHHQNDGSDKEQISGSLEMQGNQRKLPLVHPKSPVPLIL